MVSLILFMKFAGSLTHVQVCNSKQGKSSHVPGPLPGTKSLLTCFLPPLFNRPTPTTWAVLSPTIHVLLSLSGKDYVELPEFSHFPKNVARHFKGLGLQPGILKPPTEAGSYFQSERHLNESVGFLTQSSGHIRESLKDPCSYIQSKQMWWW